MKRKKTRQLFIGNVPIGGDAPVVVQSMTKTDTKNINATVRQIKSLQREGCEIVRIAIAEKEAIESLKEIKKKVNIPIIADVHFDWRLAISSIKSGVDGLRINPGNIGAEWKVKEIVNIAKEKQVPIRIGVNSGSVPKDILKKYKKVVPEALVESAERQIELLENLGFNMIKVSLKGTDVPITVDAYRCFSEKYDYPLHIGITEAGPPPSGIIKSSVGLGILLAEGIGDTIRVSLTDSPLREVSVAYEILSTIGIRKRGIDIISCPTCGRCRLDILSIAKTLKQKLKKVKKSMKIAVMGCIVNGPGEAKEADLGIAGCGKQGVIFKKGKIIKKVPQDKLIETLLHIMKEEINDGDNKKY